MSENFTLHKCNICGNIVELVEDGGGSLVCCGEEMEKIIPQKEEQFAEKHLPVVEFEGEGDKRMVKIRIGEEEHPMIKEHHIQFIEAYSKDGVYLKRKMLSPDEKPELHFLCKCDEMVVREYCNIHGLWETIV